ncbi:MAG: hypothetical protein DDT26_00770 [Dehalococcoidia bacterium]|nr:hypothetical protein [Chloroflexota bacterium]
MPFEVAFEGNWAPEDIQAAVSKLQKSLGTSEGGGAEATVQTTVMGLSARQKKLLEILQQGVDKALEPDDPPCDEPREYEAIYPLKKTIATEITSISLPWQQGAFGYGAYIPRGSTQGGVQAIYRVDRLTKAADTPSNLLLEPEGLVISDREVVLRKGSTLLGVLGTPSPAPQWVAVEVNERQIILEDQAQSLTKAAIRSTGPLDGIPLVATAPSKLDKGSIRLAIARCKADGLDLEGLTIEATSGVPQFLPRDTTSYVLAEDGYIGICPHDPALAIATQLKELTERVRLATEAGAIPADEAFCLLAKAARLTPEWWLEMLVKRGVGIVRTVAIANIFDSAALELRPYLELLSCRGAEYWGNRRQVAECIAEDFRCAHDPAGLPNLITLEWDLAVPELARVAQAMLLRILHNV